MLTTIPWMLEETLGRCPDKEAVFEGDESLTFAQMHQQALATALVLRDLGVEKGDRIGICMNKTLDQVSAILGTMYANAIFVPILPKLKRSNIAHIISDSGMKAMITDSSRLAEVKEFAEQVKIIIGHGEMAEDFVSLPYMRKHFKDAQSVFNCIGYDTSAIIYSSGSTGRPKGIVISHRNLFDGARIVADYLHTSAEDRITGVLSFNFDYGLNQLWQTIDKGASLYLHDLVLPNDLFELVSSKKLTALPVMPVILTNMFNPRFYTPNDSHNFSALRYICSSGGRVTQKMLDSLRGVFPKSDIVLMYGLTEAFRSTYLPPDQVDQRPTSIGKGIPDSRMIVLDEDGQPCPPGKPGQLVHRGGCISKGYWNDPEKTAERFREIPMFPGEMVVFSGDLVKTDDEGYLYFLARMDDMIKTHGYRVSPTEIEEEALTHERITAAVVFGVPNEEIGEDIVIAYSTDDQEPVPQSVLTQHLKDLLPRYMVPKYYAHMANMPSTGNEGKIDRISVKKTAYEELGLTTSGE